MTITNYQTYEKNHTIIAVLCIALISFLGIMSETALNIIYTLLMTEFTVNASTIQWLTTAYLLTLASFIPLSPTLVKNYPTKKLFQLSVIIFTTGVLLCAKATNFPLLLIGRIIQAVGTSIALPLMVNVVLIKIPSHERGKVMGLIGITVFFAPVIGPVFGGILTEMLNWHWIFISMLPFLLIAYIIGSKYIPNICSSQNIKLDISSALLSTITFVGLIYGLSEAEVKGWAEKTVLISLFCSLTAAIFFLKRQYKLSIPLINLNIFTYPLFNICTIILMIGMIVVLAAGFILPIYLQKTLGCTSSTAALILLPGAIINGIMAFISGKLLDKHGPKWLLISGAAFLVTATTILTFMSYNSHELTAIYALLMLGASLLGTPAQTHALNQLPPEHSADGAAVVSTLQQVAGAVGTALAGSFLATEANPVNTDLTTATDTQHAFFIFMLLAVLACILSLKARR